MSNITAATVALRCAKRVRLDALTPVETLTAALPDSECRGMAHR